MRRLSLVSSHLNLKTVVQKLLNRKYFIDNKLHGEIFCGYMTLEIVLP